MGTWEHCKILWKTKPYSDRLNVCLSVCLLKLLIGLLLTSGLSFQYYVARQHQFRTVVAVVICIFHQKRLISQQMWIACINFSTAHPVVSKNSMWSTIFSVDNSTPVPISTSTLCTSIISHVGQYRESSCPKR